ncbi:MAG: glutaminase A [Nocardioidaceae bacterium]|nr:glutaminase A [Nocardioidaceae bacterium]
MRTDPIETYLQTLQARHLELSDGAVADYIPELAVADPATFAICLATADGAVYEVGHSSTRFSIQSISKPLTHGLILDELGDEAVRRKIGVEPTGEAFNAITLDPQTGLPENPMVNAGAIAATSMVTGQDRASRLLATYSSYTDRELSIDHDVYRSEVASGHRNRAIAHLLRGSGVIDGDPEEALDLYFRQCSTEVTCRDLALIAATMANGGINPVTGAEAASRTTMRHVLTVMATCGMYDGAGDWLYTVGLPAKSGVSGGVMAVLPGKLGIAVFSPPLDEHGNSIRGLRVCREITHDLGLQLIEGDTQRPIRDVHSIAELGSKRIRSQQERAVLTHDGGGVLAIELQGQLDFPATEQAIRRLGAGANTSAMAVVDFSRVTMADLVSAPFFVKLAEGLAQRGGRLVFSGLGEHPAFLEEMVNITVRNGDAHTLELHTFAELDGALEWCETHVLAESGVASELERVPLDRHDLLQGLAGDDLDAVKALLQHREFTPGDIVQRAGESADELHLITRGDLSVVAPTRSGTPRRLATLSAGMVLGEVAFATGTPRTSNVWADSQVECYALSAADLRALGHERPEAEAVILRNLVGITGRRAARMRSELSLITR